MILKNGKEFCFACNRSFVIVFRKVTCTNSIFIFILNYLRLLMSEDNVNENNNFFLPYRFISSSCDVLQRDEL